jgi:hypothetical protein
MTDTRLTANCDRAETASRPARALANLFARQLIIGVRAAIRAEISRVKFTDRSVVLGSGIRSRERLTTRIV